MKSHAASSLQRKRFEIEGTAGMGPAPERRPVPGTRSIESRDGYDWLQKIKRAQALRITDQRRE